MTGFCMELSIVIIVCKKDIDGTERTLQSLGGLGADILLYDTSYSSFLKQSALKYNARLFEGEWEGYESVRFKASRLAIHDWILMLHTGETPDEELKASLRRFDGSDPKKVYRIRFRNLLGKKWLCHGEWGGYSHIRLANRTGVEVNDSLINEKIFSQPGIVIRRIGGYLLHSTLKDRNSLRQKLIKEATLAAIKYHRQGRNAGVAGLVFSPIAAFFKCYFIKLGLLDGKEGFYCAKLGAWYTYLKYSKLWQLNRQFKMRP